MKRIAVLVLLLLPVGALAGEKTRPMKVDDLFRFKRIADPEVRPDGRWVVYQLGPVNLEANKVVPNLGLGSTDKGATPKPLTASGKAVRHPRWSPDGKSILFESNRGGSTQLWIIDLAG